MGYPTKKLGEILKIQNGYAFDSKLFNEIEGFPIIRIRDIKNSTTNTKYKGEIKDDFIVKKGDFLIGMDGEFKCYMWKGENALLNQRVCRLLPIINDINLKYIHYGINQYLKIIEDNTSFVTVKHISSNQIKNIDFPFPLLPIQKLIVQKLDSSFEKIDKSIELTKKNLENIDELNKSVLEEIFKENGYKIKKLKDIVTLIMGQSPKSETYNRKGIGLPFFQGKKEFGEVNPIPEVYCSSPIKIAEKGDILMSVRAPVGPTNIANETCCIGRGLSAIRPSLDILELSYLLSYFKKFESEISSLGKGSTFSSITKSDLENLKIPLPPIEKQKEIVTQLDKVFKKNKALKDSYEKKLKDLVDMKQSLLKEAFEGRLVKE